jgi:hypothetical protein
MSCSSVEWFELGFVAALATDTRLFNVWAKWEKDCAIE